MISSMRFERRTPGDETKGFPDEDEALEVDLQRGNIRSWWEECWTTSRRLTARASLETIARTRALE
jgi:hypothetical protein